MCSMPVPHQSCALPRGFRTETRFFPNLGVPFESENQITTLGEFVSYQCVL